MIFGGLRLIWVDFFYKIIIFFIFIIAWLFIEVDLFVNFMSRYQSTNFLHTFWRILKVP